jgi:hypothetical protein
MSLKLIKADVFTGSQISISKPDYHKITRIKTRHTAKDLSVETRLADHKS